MSTSQQGRLNALIICINICIALIFAMAYWLQNHDFTYFILSLAVSIPISLVLINLYYRRQDRTRHALINGLLNLKDNDFSITLSERCDIEWQELITLYNDVGQSLRKERQTIYQRELMLEHVMQSSPLALILCDDRGHIIYSNLSARDLLNSGDRIDGFELEYLLKQHPAALKEAFESKQDKLFSIPIENEEEFFHFSCTRFTLNSQYHHLYLVKNLTRELNRQEVATWKKVIRVISHEINNALAPLSSMAHSGKTLASRSPNESEDKLMLIFNTMGERVEHLNNFIQGYARFAKLPTPRLQKVESSTFVQGLQQQLDFIVEQASGITLHCDPSQLEQVLINLIKNAHEAGSPPEETILSLTQTQEETLIGVRDRGRGMSDQVLQNALIPFYSTKQSGTGLGLALCREIVEAHGGRLKLSNRADGGLEVGIVLPKA